VDFLASKVRLVVEVDGGYHTRRRAADARRDRALEQLGYRVLRLSDELVLSDLPQAARRIRAALEAGQ
jgi:very-short-patch-repair endonuclease